MAKTRAVDYLFLDPRIRALIEGVLGPRVQINVTPLFNILPGETKQFLHQDDGLWPIKRPHPHFVCNALIALDDFDLENGATHIVPYSHSWHDRPVDQSIETLQVTMRAGTMLMWEGGLWHGGGANTSKNRERLGFFMSHNVAYLRPKKSNCYRSPVKSRCNYPSCCSDCLVIIDLGWEWTVEILLTYSRTETSSIQALKLPGGGIEQISLASQRPNPEHNGQIGLGFLARRLIL
ncbi:MAG: hypothetical protein CM1200mP9_04370 [Gammaproteobacteria bacterium]|nr:MAG: hypothetical protein CM1200mP9_04370 [Gammaproteobacteria bacterium]